MDILFGGNGLFLGRFKRRGSGRPPQRSAKNSNLSISWHYVKDHFGLLGKFIGRQGVIDVADYHPSSTAKLQRNFLPISEKVLKRQNLDLK